MEVVLNALSEALQRTLKTRTGVALMSASPRRNGGLGNADVCCLVGFTGDIAGRAVLSLRQDTADAIAAALLGRSVASDPAALVEALTELVQVVLDGARAGLAAVGRSFEPSPPCVLFGGPDLFVRRQDRCLGRILRDDGHELGLAILQAAADAAAKAGSMAHGTFELHRGPSGLLLTLTPPVAAGNRVSFDELFDRVEAERMADEYVDIAFLQDVVDAGVCREIRITANPDVLDRIRISYDDGHMTAYAAVVPPPAQTVVAAPATAVDRDDLHFRLRQEGITTGVLHENLLRLLRAQQENASAGAGEPLMIACAIPPRHGEDAQLRYRWPLAELEDLEQGHRSGIPAQSLAELKIVDAGEVLVTKIPPSHGIPGRNVFGKVVPARDGVDKPITPGPETGLSADGIQLLARKAGYVRAEAGTVGVVSKLLVAGDIGSDVGLVQFPGAVEVTGSLCPGAHLTCREGLRVEGAIEGAEVSCAGGSINAATIAGGAKVEAGWDIRCGVVRSSDLLAGGSVIADDMVVDSQVRAAADLRVLSREKGILRGGEYQAGHLVEAEVIGGSSDRRTVVRVAAPFSAGEVSKDPAHETFLQETLALQRDLEALHRRVSEYLRRFGTALDPAGRAAVQALYRKLDETVPLGIVEAAGEADGDPPSGRVRARGVLYADATVTIGDLSWERSETFRQVELHGQGGRIKAVMARLDDVRGRRR
ncbi:MAG: DUF342 domain-containing protein [Candidatus Schekmanbacteria bacterium]|nr:DUF342 domain-containing protein [Candidatus Schekmanbacteria bacterium]